MSACWLHSLQKYERIGDREFDGSVADESVSDMTQISMQTEVYSSLSLV